VEVVASLSQGRTAAAQCGLFTHKSVPVIYEPPCTINGTWCWQKNIHLFGSVRDWGLVELDPVSLKVCYRLESKVAAFPSLTCALRHEDVLRAWSSCCTHS